MTKQDFRVVSIIMPIRNEADFIAHSLKALLEQDYPHAYMEIVIADGLSTDGTGDLVKRFAQEHASAAIIVLENRQQFMPAGFNLALAHAQGDIIIMMGGHCIVQPNYVRHCVTSLQQSEADCVGGPITTLGNTVAAEAIALAQSSLFGVGGVSFRMEHSKAGYVDTVAFGAYRREVFDRIGNLDEELIRNQDDEFNFRLTQAGGKIWMDPTIRSTYYSRATLGKLWKQYYQYGLYKVRVIQKRGAVPSWRHLVPAAFVLSLTCCALLSVFTGSLLWLALILVPYLLTNLAASLWIARNDVRTLPLLPIAFMILHVAYGLGFLWGLWRWRAYGLPKLRLAGKVS